MFGIMKCVGFLLMVASEGRMAQVTRKAACQFDIHLVQDATAGFGEDFVQMRDTQLPLMASWLQSNHDGSRVGLVTFQDKPVGTFGAPDSYCSALNSPLTADIRSIQTAYGKLKATKAGDDKEDQFGAILRTSLDSEGGWDPASKALRVIIIMTDALAHYEGDKGNYLHLKTHPGTWDKTMDKALCEQYYYPHINQVKAAVNSVNATLIGLVQDGGSVNTMSKGWQSTIDFVNGGISGFYASLQKDSSNFWLVVQPLLEKLVTNGCP